MGVQRNRETEYLQTNWNCRRVAPHTKTQTKEGVISVINEDQQYAMGIKTFANGETVSQVNFDDIEFPVSQGY